MNVLIVAGGQGTRLWPASRKSQPKQLLKLLNDKTLLQNTYERFSAFTKPKNIFIATTQDYASFVQKQLKDIPKYNYSVEPVLRDRGPAIGLAALIIEHYQPNSCFVTAWSDHNIEPQAKFLKMLERAEKFLQKNPESIITVGVRPYFPHTGMGYIEHNGEVPGGNGLNLSRVKSFKEKPKLELAKQFLKKGHIPLEHWYFYLEH